MRRFEGNPKEYHLTAHSGIQSILKQFLQLVFLILQAAAPPFWAHSVQQSYFQPNNSALTAHSPAEHQTVEGHCYLTAGEHRAAKETDISLRSWRRAKQK